MRKLIFHDLAKQDLRLIRKYTIKNWGESQAIKYLKDLSKTMQLIKRNPFLGTQKQDIQDGAWCFFYKSHAIYFQFDKYTVVIVGVLHKSMLPKKHLIGRKM